MTNWIDIAEKEYGIVLDRAALERFEWYYRELVEWNKRFNLTAIRDQVGIEIKHFLDSLTVATITRSVPGSIIDVGTGAGFPGLALKILWPDAKLSLVESVQKKANFCVHVAETLGFSDVNVLAQRAEDIGQNPLHREKYQLVTARAVAKMPVLLEYLLPLAKLGGLVVMQKGENGAEEAEASQRIMRKLGGDLKEIRPVKLPDVEGDRYLIVVSKHAHTPKDFPRHPGTPAKTPLV
jgi:16S rRNA (guanine527-N7)-methyltransferase